MHCHGMAEVLIVERWCLNWLDRRLCIIFMRNEFQYLRIAYNLHSKTFNVHHFQNNNTLMQIGNDDTPLLDKPYTIYMADSEKNNQSLHAYLQPHSSYLISICLGFPYCRQNWWGIEEYNFPKKMTPRKSKFCKKLAFSID